MDVFCFIVFLAVFNNREHRLPMLYHLNIPLKSTQLGVELVREASEK